jgi:putative ABC transport system permease protein
LRDTATEERSTSRRRTVISCVLLLLGVAASVIGTFDDEVPIFAAGVVVLLITVFLLGSVGVRPLSRLLSVPMVWRAGVVGEMARENAARSPRRTSTTAYSLAVGVSLVTAATIFAGTIRESVTGELESSLVADHVVVVDAPVVLLGGGLTPDVVDAVGDVPGVEAAVPLQTVNGAYDGAALQVTGSHTDDLQRVADLGSIRGALPTAAGQIAVGEREAEDRGLEPGDTIVIDFPQHETTLEVVGTFGDTALVGEWLVDDDELQTSAPSVLTGRVLLDSAPGINAGVEAAIAGDPTSHLETKSEYISDQGAQVNQLLVLLYGLLGMSVVVALIGIVNTMSLSIFERTRELGLLRAIGTTRSQLRRVIRYESALVAGIGTVGGLVLGLFFGWLAAHAVDETFPDLTIPWVQVGIIGIVGVVAGVLAAVLPARRAARLDVLDAIASGG